MGEQIPQEDRLRSASHVKQIAAACLSLGGTKIEVGIVTLDRVFLLSPELHWRKSPEYAALLEDPGASGFCDLLAQWLKTFVEGNGYVLSDIQILGVPFPGPRDGELWYSNNLVLAFQHGVALERELGAALSRQSPGESVPPVVVMLDAQCDAGGELFHPAGRLSLTSSASTESAETATVLNIATGIAAGFIKDCKVLVTDEDFQTAVDPDYDAGAGQLGRHLFYHPDTGSWEYRFWPRGQVPPLTGQAVRMTERLSGPALAARLLMQLGAEFLRNDSITIPGVVPYELEGTYALLSSYERDRNLAAATQLVRGKAHSFAGSLLSWADEIYYGADTSPVTSCIEVFVQEIATELAAALNVWMNARGWKPFGCRIVLTGGAGIRFLAASDLIPERSFICVVESRLPTGCRIERSRLLRATERESYVFLQHPLVGL
jgi:hypothetical protein